MTRLEDRHTLMAHIAQARAAGARLRPACAVAGINARTLQRWNAGAGDRRPEADHPVPSHALSEAERAQIIAVANEPRFADTPPARIVPALADEGIYIASESSFHRVLRAHGQMNRRGRAQPPRTSPLLRVLSRPPTTHIATRPGEVWCWDVTFLPAQIQGRWFYFYLILDLYSRKIVGFEVHDTESAEHAAHLARRTALAEGVHAKPVRPVLHGDNGATLKATTVLAMLHWLGIEPSYSRPRVSDDNAFAEALFRTAKYRPEFPLKGFADLDAATHWAARFVHWYNEQHRHSGIRYVTPAQRHAGQDGPVLAARHVVYQDARQRNPQRWSGLTRDWTPVGVVTLNPERDTVVRAATSQIQLSGSIGEPAFSFFNRRPFGKGGWTAPPPIHWTRDASRDTSPDARTTTPRRSRRDPRRAVSGLQGATQGNRGDCAGEAAGRYPIPSTRRSAQPTATVGRRGADAGRPTGPV